MMRIENDGADSIYMISPLYLLYLWSHDAMRKRYPALAAINPPK